MADDQIRELRRARRQAESLARADALSAAEEALRSLHPEAGNGDIEGWAEDVIAYRRGRGNRSIRMRTESLLGAGHPLLRGEP